MESFFKNDEINIKMGRTATVIRGATFNKCKLIISKLDSHSTTASVSFDCCTFVDCKFEGYEFLGDYISLRNCTFIDGDTPGVDLLDCLRVTPVKA